MKQAMRTHTTNIFSEDKHFYDGLMGRQFTGYEFDDHSGVSYCAYLAGLRMAGRDTPKCYETKQSGCASIAESLHPANFRADA